MRSRVGHSARATLAVARKMVAYLLAVDRGERDFVSAERYQSGGLETAAWGRKLRDHKRAGCQVLPLAD